MNKTLLYLKFSYKFFMVVFMFTTLPFLAIRMSGFDLKELPFMFIALVGLVKFFLVKSQDTASVAHIVKAKTNRNLSKQELVDLSADYKNSQDIALLINAAAIFILNIVI
ncbi:MAG: hypothetical protein KC478_00295 [Bacteriovoracaceae bacterium]|nr:hypothetical protein [Bacteriovoracaceae bacterium]